MALATLSIDLEARLANLQAGFDKASRLAEKSANDIEAKFNKTAAAAAGIGAAIAGAFSVGALVQYFRTATDGLDRLNDLKDATGATIENISALEDVALRTGTSFESMASSLVKFNKALTEANTGSETANIFKRLGLDAEELRRVDPAEALRRTAVALAQFADDGSKARVTWALFGKSVQEAAPFLKNLAEAGKLNATVTTAQAQAAEDFNKQLANFSKNSIDSARAISGPLIGAFNELFVAINNAKAAYGSFGAGLLDQFRSTTGTINGDLLEAAQKIAVIRSTIENADQGKTKPLFADQRKSLMAELDLLERREKFLRLSQLAQGGGRGKVNPGDVAAPSFGDLPGKTEKATGDKFKTFDRIIDPAALLAIKALEDTDAFKIAQLSSALDKLFEQRASGLGSDQSMDQAIENLRNQLAKLDPVQQAAAKAKERLDKLLEATPTAKLAEVLKDVELINAAFESGAIKTVEQWAEAIRVSVGKLPDETGQALDKMSDLMKDFQQGVEATLGSTIRDSLSGDFDKIGKLWENLLLDMVVKATAADVSKRLFGDSKGNAGALASLFSLFGGGYGFTDLGFAKGGAFGAGGSVMAFADGGVLTRATPFGMSGGRMGVAGEAGPEAVLPLKRGADGKLGVAGGGSGGVVINVAAGVNRGEVTTAIQLAMDTVKGDIFTTLRAKRVL